MNSGFSLPRWLLVLAFGITAPMTFAQSPTVTTHTADQLTTSTARLRGQINPNGFPTVAWFEWGTTTNYGNVTANQDMGTGVGVVPALQALTILSRVGLNTDPDQLAVGLDRGVGEAGDVFKIAPMHSCCLSGGASIRSTYSCNERFSLEQNRTAKL